MDERFVEILGKNIIKIAQYWESLSAQDLIEIKEKCIKEVWCVYNDWLDLAATLIDQDKNDENIPKYLTECVDINVVATYLKDNSADDYIELESGKVIKGEFERR